MPKTFVTVTLLLVAQVAAAQGPENVLLVINESSPASVEIGDYYAAQRKLSPNHVLRLKTVTSETIQRPEYERTLDLPIGAWLTPSPSRNRPPESSASSRCAIAVTLGSRL